jgi:hypothetical protein
LACLKLAMFLFRSGRTNELGWNDDTNYSPRSACIFSHVASELGFNKTMVELIAQSFDFEAPLKSTYFWAQKSSAKANLYQTLFHIVHTLELSRCFSSRGILYKKVSNLLSHFFSIQESKVCWDRMFQLTGAFLKATGSQNACAAVGSRGLIGKDNPYLQVQTVHELDISYSRLQSIKENYAWFCSSQNPQLPIRKTYTHRNSL